MYFELLRIRQTSRTYAPVRPNSSNAPGRVTAEQLVILRGSSSQAGYVVYPCGPLLITEDDGAIGAYLVADATYRGAVMQQKSSRPELKIFPLSGTAKYVNNAFGRGEQRYAASTRY